MMDMMEVEVEVEVEMERVGVGKGTGAGFSIWTNILFSRTTTAIDHSY